MSEQFHLSRNSDSSAAALAGHSGSEFQKLMEQIATGSEAAVGILLRQYGGHLYRAVRRRLNRALRAKFDTSDFVQSVWASFFDDRARLAKFEHSSDLVAFLTRVASNKVVDECRRRLGTKKADVRRETPIHNDEGEEVPVPGREPTPSQVAIGREQLGQMMDEVPPEYQKILQLRAAGETHQEIAHRLGVNERTVRRVLAKLERRVKRRK